MAPRAPKKNAAEKGPAKRAASSSIGVSTFQSVFKNVDDILRKDSGCTSELDYTEQSSWLLFLRYLDALESDRQVEAELTGKRYSYVLKPEFRWSSWAAPKNADGEIDYNKAKTGQDLLDFVNDDLFPYLRGFRQSAPASDTIEYKIGEIFDEVTNKIRIGYNLRDVIDQLDKLQFRLQDQKHELSDLYEVKIRNMGNAGRNGGEYYTPRPLIRSMIKVVDPQIGESIYDPALGSAGFLCESFEYLSSKPGLTTSKMKTLQSKTFFGKEKKSLAYVIAIMNMILHGIDAPNVVHVNTLSENVQQIQAKDRHDIVLANPPFGGSERAEVQQNFPIRSSETAYLFLQHFIKSLKPNGRAAVVIKNTFLSNTDSASVALRRELLEECNLHTILDLPSGTFQGAGVRTVVLFFEKGSKTKRVWFYKLNPGRNLGKTNPLNDADLEDFVTLQKSSSEGPNSWLLDVTKVDQETWELTTRNPNAEGPVELGSPTEILAEIRKLEAQSKKLLSDLEALLA
jgi:type I restriction enzyme M protein